MITAIIPIDLSRRSKDITSRALLLSEYYEKTNIKIIYGVNNRNTRQDKKFLKAIQKFKNTTVNIINSNSTLVNTSLLRNVAFEGVKTKYTLLLDVDIYPEKEIFYKYLTKLEQGKSSFYILPCLYLTRYGSNILLKKRKKTYELKEDFFNFSRKEFLHLASPSSITLLKTSDYQILKGFNENFEGHGYEDFDFLIRLAKLHNRISFDSDFIVDKPARSPLFATGFRKHLGKLCLEQLLEKDMVMHVFHSKNDINDYYSRRQQNFIEFKCKHGLNLSERVYSEPSLLNLFLSSIYDKHIDVTGYSILFENKPGHIDRYDTFKRKMRFLFK
ncbi:galactosyltransferase-related protein [Pantoea sp.]|uniref:galactosyltransferase-related protein n=1 Tax=Pantoea sp. TaxID=69393 RepID=UPI0028A00AB5|nr:galactosyltransferase-related protein [Pantoea sp.]